jgi:hypothetical protein
VENFIKEIENVSDFETYITFYKSGNKDDEFMEFPKNNM